MKNFYKFLGIITIVAVIGFSVIGCSTEDDSGGNSGGSSSGGSTSGGNDSGGSNSGGSSSGGSDSGGSSSGGSSSGGSNSGGSSSGGSDSGGSSSGGSSSGGSSSGGSNSGGSNSGGSSSGGSNSGGTTTPKPSTPSGVKATAQSATSIQVSWNSVSGATGYRVYRSSSSSGTYSVFAGAVTPITGTSWDDTGLQPDTTYYYKVSAVNSGGESNQSTSASATTPQVKPNAPYGIMTKSAQATTSSLTIEWDAAGRATGYNLYYATSSSGPFAKLTSTNSSTRTYTHTGLSSGTTYYYKVTATNSAGESDYSPVAQGTTK